MDASQHRCPTGVLRRACQSLKFFYRNKKKTTPYRDVVRGVEQFSCPRIEHPPMDLDKLPMKTAGFYQSCPVLVF